jgi:hypothetical protein
MAEQSDQWPIQKRQFFAKNWEKLQKIVIITSTSGHPEQRAN